MSVQSWQVLRSRPGVRGVQEVLKVSRNTPGAVQVFSPLLGWGLVL